MFIRTAKDYFSDHYSKKTAVIHVSEAKLASETSTSQPGSCDSSDRLPKLKCPSVDRLRGSDECQERQADRVIDLGYESKFQVGFYRSNATTLTEQRGHTSACKVHSRYEVSRLCTYDRQIGNGSLGLRVCTHVCK